MDASTQDAKITAVIELSSKVGGITTPRGIITPLGFKKLLRLRIKTTKQHYQVEHHLIRIQYTQISKTE